MTKELKGHHVLIIAITAFAVIVAANLTMLFAATGSFPGLVVKNSYVAGVGWNDRTARQAALGWQATASYTSGSVGIDISDNDGLPVSLEAVRITIGRPASDMQDQTFTLTGELPHSIPMTLAPGKWRIALTSQGKATYATHLSLFVPEAD